MDAFVDGENLTIQAEKIGKEKDLTLTECEYYSPGVFVWMPKIHATNNLYDNAYLKLGGCHPILFYYYTATTDDDQHKKGQS